MERVRLNTGANIPSVGFGTWQLRPGGDTEQAVALALQTGYRLLDTAKLYGNEGDVGTAIRNSGVSRDEIFVTTKLWNDDQGYDSAFMALDTSLQKLGLDYVDLYLIHWPATTRRGETWRAFEELQRQGKAKNIGVSNYTVTHLEQLLADSRTIPAVNQVEFHPFIYEQQRNLLLFCKQHGIVVEAYSPLSRLTHESNVEIHQIAERIGKSSQQVVLRWCLQHGTVPLPRSNNPEHIKSNLDIFDFELTNEDMQALNLISDGERVTWDPADMSG